MKRILLATTAILAGLATVFPAHAQTNSDGTKASSAATAGAGKETETIYVTATKRGAVDAQATAISLTAFDARKIDQLNAFSTDDVIAQVPSTNFIDNGGPGRGYEVASIRGLSPVADNTVGVVAQYLDGAPHYVPNYNLYDIGEVAVLRGPQGTLWGAQSIGGLISYRSNRPDLDKFSAQILEDSYLTSNSSGLSDRTQGVVNVPIISNQLAVRAAGYYLDERGYIDNVTTGASDVNKVHEGAWRVSALYQPTDNLTFTVIYHGNHLRTGASSYFDIDLNGWKTSAPYSDWPAKEDSSLINFLVDANLGWATLSYSGSVFNMTDNYYQYNLNDLDMFPVSRDSVSDKESATTHELRLASTPGGKLNWVLGAYYDNYFQNQLETDAEVADPTLPGSPVLGDGYVASAIGGPQRTVQKAVFGEASYDFTDQWQVSLGGRYFWWSVNNHQQTTYFGSNYNQTVGHVGGDDFLYKAQISYKPVENITIYALRSQGFRPGGFNPFVGPALGIPESFLLFKPDTLTNYEIGAKTSWFDGKLLANGAFYYDLWHNIQTVVYNESGSFAFTTNGPQLTAKGFELELQSQDLIYPGVYAAASYSYTTNRFDEGASIFPGVPELIHEGDSLRRTPRDTWSLDLGYNFALTDDVNAFVRTNYWHKAPTSTKGFNGNDGDIAVPGQDVFNAQLGAAWSQWQARLYVKNLTGTRPLQQIFPNASNDEQPAIASSIRPRTIGLELSRSF